MSVFRALYNKAKRVVAVIRFGVLTLRYAGLRFALRQLGHQLYSHTVFLYTTGEMTAPVRPPRFPSYTVRATEEDVKEVFNQMHSESNTGKYQLLVRKWHHERGLGIPYVQKTIDTNEMCCIRWLATAENIEKTGLADRFPKLEEDEFILENVYTLERFRSKGVQTSSNMYKITQGMGLSRIKGQVAEDNIIELRALKGWDTKVSERVLERHLFFRVTRKSLERYDPPIPITIPGENE